ncbi:unnamed protein product [Ilex paraguariensis]|uniref:Uncharacterized protein n=1 Tax=Ilex paraguariensis TaxID=185542 RepID=A0ABC8RVP7_9AQUA
MLYKLVGLVEYLRIIVRKLQGTTPNTVHALGVYDCSSSIAEYTSSSETPKQSQALTSLEVQITNLDEERRVPL